MTHPNKGKRFPPEAAHIAKAVEMWEAHEESQDCGIEHHYARAMLAAIRRGEGPGGSDDERRLGATRAGVVYARRLPGRDHSRE